MKPFIHSTANRIRVRSDFIRTNPKLVAAQLVEMKNQAGIVDISFKRYAGSVAIVFDDKNNSAQDIMQMIEDSQWLSVTASNELVGSLTRNYAKKICKGVAMLALRKTLAPSLLKAISAV